MPLNRYSTVVLAFSKIEKLPSPLHVKILLLADTPIEYLPDDLTVDGTLDIRGTNIEEIPNRLKVGELLCEATPLIIYYKYRIDIVKKLIEKKGGEVKSTMLYT